MGRRASRLLVRRAHLGRMFEVKRMRSPEAVARSRAFGFCTSTGPIPVWIARTGSCPWRTTRRRPSGSTSSSVEARNVSNSASTAWAINRRAPVRRISVSGSSIAPFCRRATTLFSVTAPDALHRTHADADRLGHRRAGPMRRFVRRLLHGQRDDALVDRRIELRDARGPCLVAQKTVHAFDGEALLPAPDTGLGLAGLAHDRVSADA